MRSLKSMLLISTVFALASVATASIIDYDFTGQPGNQVSTAGTSSFPTITVTPVTRGAGLTATAANNYMAASGWVGPEATDYFTFGFTVQAGYTANLTNFIFASRSSGTGPGNMAIRTSLDNYATNVATFDAGNAVYNNLIINLSSLGPITGSFTIRITPTSNVSANGGTTATAGTWRIGNYYDTVNYTPARIEGTVTPEPTSFILIGLGLAGLLRRR
jgi:hypothetical protein